MAADLNTDVQALVRGGHYEQAATRIFASDFQLLEAELRKRAQAAGLLDVAQ